MASNPIRPADLTAFLRALELTADRAAPIDADAVALVESAWQIHDTIVSSFGWIVALKSGRRLHLEYTLDDSRPRAPEDIELTELAPDQTFPALDSDAGVLWYRPDHINAHLGPTGPSLH